MRQQLVSPWYSAAGQVRQSKVELVTFSLFYLENSIMTNNITVHSTISRKLLANCNLLGVMRSR